MVLEGFEKFTQQGRSFKPKISIRKRGQIGFNNGAIKRFNLDQYEFVVLYINKDKNQIAFNFTNSEEEEGATKLVKRKNNFFISGKSFLDYYNIPYEESQVFDAEWIPEHLVAIVNLGETIGERGETSDERVE